MSGRKRRFSEDSDDLSSTGSIDAAESLSLSNDPLDSDCKLLLETCQMYGSCVGSLDDTESTFAGSDSDDDLNEMCLDGDVDCLQRIVSETDNGVLVAESGAGQLQLSPEDAMTLLNINKAYQRTIERKIMLLQAKIHCLRERKMVLKQQSESSLIHGRKFYVLSQKDCNPFFQDNLRRGPKLGSYAMAAIEQCVNLNMKRNFRPFSMEHAEEFACAVAEDIKSQLLREPEKTIEKLRLDEDRDDVEYSEALEASERIKAMTQEELLAHEELFDSVDWNRFSAKNEWSPSATACRSIWHNLLKPGINRSKWTMEETKHLLRITDHIFDWTEVAQVLGTGRSPYMCMKRFMEKEPMRDKPFLFKPEQKELLRIVEENRVGHHISWTSAAYQFQKRNREVLISINISIEEGVKRTRWTKSETDLLMNAVRNYGFTYINWLEISRHVPGRSGTMCARKYAVVCNKQLRQHGLLEIVAKLYDQIKSEGGTSHVNSDFVFSSHLWCILNACSLNEIIYKWLRAQRDYIRNFLLTYYKNQDYRGPVRTPMKNLIYPQPVVKMRPGDMAVLSTQKAKDAIEKLIEFKEKGVRPVLPSLSNLVRFINEEEDADAFFERIQDYTTRTESIARQRNLWQLQHFQYTAKYRKDRIEYLHCMAGSCYVRKNAQIGAQVSDLVDDILTALVIYDNLNTDDDASESLERVSAMLGLTQDLLLTGVLSFASNIRLSDLNKLLIESIRGRREVIHSPIVLAASYVWSACESAKCCGSSHKMTARYVPPVCREWSSFKSQFFDDKECIVCPKFTALMHRYLPPLLLNYAKLVNDHLAEHCKHRLEFVGTSIRQHMVWMYGRIAMMPTHRVKVQNGQKTRDARKVASEVIRDIVYTIVENEKPKRQGQRKPPKRKKVSKKYMRGATQKFNVALPKHSCMVQIRCESEVGSKLIERVTTVMNEDGRHPRWTKRQTKLIYSIISGIVIRIEKSVGLTGIKRVHRTVIPDNLRRSARLVPPEKSRPWTKISEGRDVVYTPRRQSKPRKSLKGKRLGRPCKEDELRKLEIKKRISNRIFLKADYACNLSQTERFAICARTLSMDVPSLLASAERFTRHYRQLNNQMMIRMVHCVKLQFPADSLPKEMEIELSGAFARCLFTILRKNYVDQMVQKYLATVNCFDEFSSETPRSRKRKAPDDKLPKVKPTRFQSRRSVQLTQANFTSPYWHPALSRNIDVDAYSMLRQRLRVMLGPALKKMITEESDPESVQRVKLLDHASESVRTALQSYYSMNGGQS